MASSVDLFAVMLSSQCPFTGYLLFHSPVEIHHHLLIFTCIDPGVVHLAPVHKLVLCMTHCHGRFIREHLCEYLKSVV